MIETNDFWEQQMDLLAQQEYVIIDSFFTAEELLKIHYFFQRKQAEGVFHKAAIGAKSGEKIIKEIRGDYTYWLDKNRDHASFPVFDALDLVKNKINQLLYLSLTDYEFHLAHYPEGTFYKKHLDRFDKSNKRMISMIIYLNTNWVPKDGGELRIYPKDIAPIDIAPVENRCVLFRSDTLFHEVLQANKSRKSITGWMLYQPAHLVL